MTRKDILNTLRPLLHESESAEINYGHGAIRIEKGRNANFSARAISHNHWPASKRDPPQAREAIADILTIVNPTN